MTIDPGNTDVDRLRSLVAELDRLLTGPTPFASTDGEGWPIAPVSGELIESAWGTAVVNVLRGGIMLGQQASITQQTAIQQTAVALTGTRINYVEAVDRVYLLMGTCSFSKGGPDSAANVFMKNAHSSGATAGYGWQSCPAPGDALMTVVGWRIGTSNTPQWFELQASTAAGFANANARSLQMFAVKH